MLKPEVGARVKIEFEGVATPITALLVGMEMGRYLVVRLPAGQGIGDHLYEGKRLVAKYVGDGKVYGFKSVILAYLFKKGLIIAFISYPQNVETFELRSVQRIDCYLPASISIDGQPYNGLVLDISPGGCRFGFSPKVQVPQIKPGPDLSAGLNIKVLGQEETRKIVCAVMNAQTTGNIRCLGLKFDQIDEALSEEITGYVSEVLEYLESEG